MIKTAGQIGSADAARFTFDTRFPRITERHKGHLAYLVVRRCDGDHKERAVLPAAAALPVLRPSMILVEEVSDGSVRELI
jgi:hypothetical protein